MYIILKIISRLGVTAPSTGQLELHDGTRSEVSVLGKRKDGLRSCRGRGWRVESGSQSCRVPSPAAPRRCFPALLVLCFFFFFSCKNRWLNEIVREVTFRSIT